MLYIILIIITLLVYLIYKNVKIRPEKNKQASTEEILQRAQENKEKILDKCKRYSLYGDEIDMIKAMETDTLKLYERYKHNSKIALQVLNDYLVYTIALLKIINADIFDEAKSSVGHGDFLNSLDEYHKETKNPRIIIYEIGRRMMEMIGENSSYKTVLNKPSSSGTPEDKGKVKISDRYK